MTCKKEGFDTSDRRCEHRSLGCARYSDDLLVNRELLESAVRTRTLLLLLEHIQSLVNDSLFPSGDLPTISELPGICLTRYSVSVHATKLELRK